MMAKQPVVHQKFRLIYPYWVGSLHPHNSQVPKDPWALQVPRRAWGSFNFLVEIQWESVYVTVSCAILIDFRRIKRKKVTKLLLPNALRIWLHHQIVVRCCSCFNQTWFHDLTSMPFSFFLFFSLLTPQNMVKVCKSIRSWHGVPGLMIGILRIFDGYFRLLDCCEIGSVTQKPKASDVCGTIGTQIGT